MTAWTRSPLSPLECYVQERIENATTKGSDEYDKFNSAMNKILKVPGAAVKAELEMERKERARKRKVKRAFANHASDGNN